MRCDKCRASVVVEYPESYEQDWYCACGVEDNDREEFPNLELGCRLHYKTINKICDDAYQRDTEMATNEYLRSGY